MGFTRDILPLGSGVITLRVKLVFGPTLFGMPQCLPTKYWNPSAHSPLRRSHVSTGSSTSRRRPTCSHAWIECFQVEVSRSVLRWVREQDNSYPTVHGSWEHHRLNHALLEKDMLLPRRVFQSERDDSLYHSSANNKQMELNKQIYIYIYEYF